jgi:parallel beta-helix repeat protein
MFKKKGGNMVSGEFYNEHALKLAVGIMILALLQASGAGAVTITVNASGNADYTKIQDAVNASNNGDTITVASGTYYENVVVNKSVNLVGAGEEVTTVQAFDPDSHVFYVTSDGVNISGFTLTGATSGYHPVFSSGIFLWANNTRIFDNNISNNLYGIYIFLGFNNNLTRNFVSSNYYGIYLMLSSNNTIYDNFFNNHNNFRNSGNNIWNTTKQAGTNIAGGQNLGGNFWAYLSGTGFSLACADDDLDGICDFSYTLSPGNIDYLPLTIPRGYINGSVFGAGDEIFGAIISTNTGVTTTTDISGLYSFLVPAGSYNLTATRDPQYLSNNSVFVTVIPGTTVEQDIELVKKPTGNITGSVTS